MSNQNDHVDLDKLAYEAMVDAGFLPEPTPDAKEEIRTLHVDTPPGNVSPDEVRDLRALLWSSIDNEDSRDLDQIEYAEPADHDLVRFMVAIADVDALVPPGSAVDRYAAHNCTSVYTGVRTFPMLPDELSEGLTSLLPEQDRLAVVTEMILDRDGNVVHTGVFRAMVRNRARLDYDSVGAWIEERGPIPDEVRRVEGLEDQLLLQYRATEAVERLRERNGALNFETIEPKPIKRNGEIIGLKISEENEARGLIENLMVAANGAIAGFLRSHGAPAIERVVREPERWPKIVELARHLGDDLPANPDSRALTRFLDKHRRLDRAGFPDLSLAIVKLLGAADYEVIEPGESEPGHFGLGLRGYSRSTAPNRRYVDLVTQRLLKAVAVGAPLPYSIEELDGIIANCTRMESSARKVERRLRKAAAALVLGHRIGERFRGIVTGSSPRGTYVRLFNPPAEGRVVSGFEGMDVGETVSVRLIDTDPYRGFIDFSGR